jgi:hypothetical protein
MRLIKRLGRVDAAMLAAVDEAIKVTCALAPSEVN